jgi:hypothetical protein
MRSVLAALLLGLVVVAVAGAAPTVVARIPVSASLQPCAAAAGGKFVWVSGYGMPYLLKIDPRRNKVVSRTPIGYGSCGLGFGAGSLWIEDTSTNTITRVSATTGKRTAAVKVGSTPYDATFAYGSAWATANAGGDVERIDPAHNRVVKRFPLSGAVGVVGAFGSVWGAGTDGVIRIDPATNTFVATIPVASAGWTAASDDAIWITTPTGVSRIDPATNAVTATVPLVGPLGDPDVVAGNVWVPQIRSNRIARVDPATNTVTGFVKTGTGPFVVTQISGEAWVPSWKGKDIWRIRP